MAEDVKQIPAVDPPDGREIPEDIFSLLGGRRGRKTLVEGRERGSRERRHQLADRMTTQGPKDFEVAAPVPGEEEAGADVYADAFLVRRPIPEQVDLTPAPVPRRPPTITHTGQWGALIAVDFKGQSLVDVAKRMGYRGKAALERFKKQIQRNRDKLKEWQLQHPNK